MAAVHSLLLLLTTLAPYTEPALWNGDRALDLNGGLVPCTPFLKPEGDRECPANEHYERCGNVCMRSCIRYECPLRCCVEGCFCDEGHVRGPNGTCIHEEECRPPPLFSETNRIDEPAFDSPKECGPDEYIGCDSNCQRNCSNYHDVIMCSKTCVLDCVCILPKIRGPDGSCIFPHQCPSPEYKMDDLLICNYIRMMNPEDERCFKSDMPCNDPFGCTGDASEGFPQSTPEEIMSRIKLRNGNEERTPCFPSADLKGRTTCPTNEHYEECGAICMDTCFEYECVLQCCIEGCFCDEGYVRDPSRHTCIPKEHCPNKGLKAERCKPEELLTCHSRCERTCDNYRDENRKCPDECHVGCVCLPPKVRGPDGECILPKECPPTIETMLEEHMKMAAMICNFVRIMGNPPAWSDSCPMIVHECTDPGECIERNSSPPLLGQFSICRKNEYLNILPSCPVTCENYQNETKECKAIDMVVPRCDCKEGLVRDSNGWCISPDNCPKKEEHECTDPNECPGDEDSPPLLGHFSICRKNEYLNVLPSCPVTCHNYRNKTKTCELTDRVVPRCDCRGGFARDSYGGCVPTEKCLAKEDSQVCPEHEEWKSCGSACPKTCKNFDVNGTCQDLCQEGCFCQEPRVRGPDGGCVLIEECLPKSAAPSAPECPKNEFWSECGSACPKTCSHRRRFCPTVCVRGCVCKNPLVRGPHGDCIEVENCP